MATNLGINVVEVDGRATPSIQAAPTSVAGFVIRSQRGLPGRVRRISNWTQFVEHFGRHLEGAYGAYALRGFLDNGGSVAFVTRVVNTSPGDATAAEITSSEGPWSISPGGTLSIDTDLSGAPLTATFIAEQAELVGGAGPFDLVGGAGGAEISLLVNGLSQGAYEFEAGDFVGGLIAAEAQEVAAVLNREFVGVQAFVDGGVLRVRTDRRGTGASLQALGAGATELGFAGAASGTGNVADSERVSAAEAVALIDAEVGPAGLLVSEAGNRIRIAHPDTGAGRTIQVLADPDSVHDAFGFDTDLHEGTDGDAAAAATPASRALAAGGATALTVTAAYRGLEDPGQWGADVAVRIAGNPVTPGLFDLSVRYRGAVVEVWEALSMATSAPTFVEDVINDAFSGSKYIMVNAAGAVMPDATTGQPGADAGGYFRLDNGSDGAFATRSDEVAALADAIDLFELHDIQLLACPEAHEPALVTRALGHCLDMGDRMFVGHTPPTMEADSIRDNYSSLFQGEKVYGALYFPWIQVADPTGRPRWIPPTGHILGTYARTEQERGIWKAPAGVAARLNGALDVRFHITDTDHTDLVKNGSVNAVRFVPGQGIILDSSRTLSTSPLWLYVNLRLLFNFVKSSLKAGLRWAVQEPNTPELWNKVKYNSVTPFLLGLWRRGAFGPGAPEEVFTVKIDAENNPPDRIQQGILTVEVYMYPSRPAETVIITVGQQEGGATASES